MIAIPATFYSLKPDHCSVFPEVHSEAPSLSAPLSEAFLLLVLMTTKS